MDEPCSALDPIATLKVEELMRELVSRYTIVIVTHNMQQAARVSTQTGFMLLGELVEFGADRRRSSPAPRTRAPRTTSAAGSGEPEARCEHDGDAARPHRQAVRRRAADAQGQAPAHGRASSRSTSPRRCARSASATSRGAEKVEQSDRQVNLLEMEIDELCIRLLALRQPAASDLRFIAAALKIVTDLERIGDLAVNIAERAEALARSPQLLPVARSRAAWPRRRRRCCKDSLDAFVRGDADKAEHGAGARQRHRRPLRATPSAPLIDSMKRDPADRRARDRPHVHRQAPRAHRRPRHQHRRDGGVPGARARTCATSSRCRTREARSRI